MDFYCDISAIGNEYQAYADTPATWGVPQDGNGKAGPGHSAAVAIATIDVAGCTASGTGTIGVLGVTVSSTLNASGSALATAIANAINAATTTVNTSTVSALGRPLNRLVFARVDPGLNTRVQIMMRIAGADWNGVAPTQANISPAATIGAFAGGADGPFGYLWNFSGAAFGLTGGNNVAPTYGIMLAAGQGIQTPTINDPIYVRTRRSGANLSLSHSCNASIAINICPTGIGRTVIFDDGTVWTGDDGQLSILTTYTAGSGGSSLEMRNEVNMLARKKYGFRWRHYGTNVSDLSIRTASSDKTTRFENLFFEEDPNAGNTRSFSINASITISGSGMPTHIEKGCRWFQKTGRNFAGNNAGGASSSVRYLECLFEYPAGVSGIVPIPTAGQEHVVEFIQCEFKDINSLADPVLTSPVTGSAARQTTRIVFDQCKGVAPFTTPLTWNAWQSNSAVIWRAPGEDNAFRVESSGYVSEWRPNANIPTLSSQLLSGEPWAYKIMLREVSHSGFMRNPVKVEAKYRSSTAIRTIALELLVPTAVTFNKSQLGMMVEYTDENDVPRMENSLLGALESILGTAPAIASSSASWTLNGTTGYTARKLELTTQYPIKSGTRVSLSLVSVGILPGAANVTIYLDPTPVFA